MLGAASAEDNGDANAGRGVHGLSLCLAAHAAHGATPAWRPGSSATRPCRAATSPARSTPETCSVIGMSTACSWASSRTAAQDVTPSAVCAVIADNLVHRHSPAEVLAERPVAGQRRRAGGDQVADSGQTHEGQRVGFHRDAESGHLGQTAGHDRRLAVVTEPHPLGHPVASAMTFLTTPPSSTPTTSALVYGRKYGVRVHSCTCVATSPSDAGDHAGGGLPLDDLAGEVGAGEHRDALDRAVRLRAPRPRSSARASPARGPSGG